MESKVIMTNNNYKQKQNELKRSLVDRVKVRVPRNSGSACGHDCQNGANAKSLLQNYSNFNQSASPQRFMCYEDGSWVDFKGDVLEEVRSCFAERKPVAEVLVGGSRWLIDFHRMLMVDFEVEDQKSIAWIDFHGKCFFPRKFVSGGTVNRSVGIGNSAEKLSIEIEVKFSDNLTKRIREKVELESDGESSSNDQPPGESRKRKLDSQESPELKKKKLILSDCDSPRWRKAKLLKEDDKAYQIVKNLFLTSGLGGATITGIHQYTRTGPLDRARTEVFQKQVEMTKASRGGEANSTFAWYGTSAKEVESILAYGFGEPSKLPDSEAHGTGIYLSPVRSPHASTMLSEVDDNGERHAILCRIILGKCEKVAQGSQQSYPSSVNFDTGVDDLAHPKWYIVWSANMNTHLLPECVVSYRLSHEVPGRLNVSPITSLMQFASTPLTTKLLTRLEQSLPYPKLQALRTLCGGYKGGKLTRDTFMKQLRSIVGDEMLHSAVREIRG